MCDYSLHNVKSRPAKVGDKLTTHNFNTGTRGFAAPEDASTAVCVLPGTELAFAKEVKCGPNGLFGFNQVNTVNHTTAIFRQINKDEPRAHHDALEFPDGQIVRLTDVFEGQEATVLQLPAQPATATEAKAQERVAHVGWFASSKSVWVALDLGGLFFEICRGARDYWIMTDNTSTFMELTASIVSAYVRHNSVPSAELPALIGQVHTALTRVSSGQGEALGDVLRPAVPIKKSITPD